MTKQIKKIALIGLGRMGSAVAKKILEAKFNLCVYNRTASKMQPLLDLGAKGASSIQEAVNDADVVITCLLDDKAVLEAVTSPNGILENLKPGAIHICTSTILPATSKKLTELHNNTQTIYVAGNVLGIPKVAEQGALTSLVAGNLKAIHFCEPIFKTYSKKIINAGDEPYKANVMKICTNYLLATTIECMGELYTFAEKNGLESEYVNGMFHEVYAHPAFTLYADKIQKRDFDDVNFDLQGGLKDLNLFQQAFTDVQIVPDFANVIKNKFIIALAHGLEKKDWSAVTEVTRMLAGLK